MKKIIKFQKKQEVSKEDKINELVRDFVKYDGGFLAETYFKLSSDIKYKLHTFFMEICMLADKRSMEEKIDLFTPDKLIRAEKNFDKAANVLKKCLQEYDDKELLELVLYCQSVKYNDDDRSRNIFEAITDNAIRVFTARNNGPAKIKQKAKLKRIA